MFVLGTWVRRSRQRIHRPAGYGVHAEPEMLRASAEHQTRIMGGAACSAVFRSTAAFLPGRRRILTLLLGAW